MTDKISVTTYLENRILKTISVKKRFLPGGREPEGEGAEYSKTSEALREERNETNRSKQPR